MGKKSAARIAFFTGAAVGAISLLRGAQIGAVVGSVGGSVAAASGSLAGASLAAVFAGSAGGAMGASLGAAADESFLDNRECLDCHFTFREERGSQDLNRDGQASC